MKLLVVVNVDAGTPSLSLRLLHFVICNPL